MSKLPGRRLGWLCTIAWAMLLPIPSDGRDSGSREPAQLWWNTAPAVDHHQHLFSEDLAALVHGRPGTPIELPAGLAELVSRRERSWDDEAGLLRLFADDSLVLLETWVRGKKDAAAGLSRYYASPYRITPTDYRTNGQTATVSGYLARGEASSATPFAHFHLGLQKSDGGAWKIATEIAAFPFSARQDAITGERLIGMLDAAGIARAVVLSEAFWLDSPMLQAGGETYRQVMAENDWTVKESRRFGDRLVPFCSFNPLQEYARTELNRCADKLEVTGLKLSFGTSGVDLGNPDHVARVREVFQQANRRGMALVVHVRDDRDYGRTEAETFIRELLSAAPDVPVQVAHLWGGEQFSDDALAAYADAVSSDPGLTRNLYFDVAEVAVGASREELEQMARRIRQIGVERILYGSDAAFEGREEPWAAWKTFASSVPLTSGELQVIARNEAPYLRSTAGRSGPLR